MSSATLWADTDNSMWFGLVIMALGLIMAGGILYLITRKEKDVDNDG